MRQVCPDRHVAPFGEFRPLVHGLARVAAVGLVEADVVVRGEDDVGPDVVEGGLRELGGNSIDSGRFWAVFWAAFWAVFWATFWAGF